MLLHLLTAAVGTSQTPRDVGLESAISFLMIIVLPDLLQAAWDRAQPGREAAAQNELLRAFQPCPPSGKPGIEPTPPNDRV